MIGLVAGLLLTLVVSGLCSLCFNMDLNWWIALEKPSFVLSGGWFSVFVAASYLSSVLAISRLVEFKHIFPSMLYFVILGVFCILFMLAFFTLKNLLFGLICMCVVLAVSYLLFIRFLTKEIKIAIEFLPTFLFNIYGYLCVLCIFLNN
mgnify:FL=1